MDHRPIVQGIYCTQCKNDVKLVTFGLLPLSAEEMRLVMAVGAADELEVVTTSDMLMLASSSSTKSIEVTSGGEGAMHMK